MLLSGGVEKGVRWDDELVSAGWPGPIARKLLAMRQKDQKGSAGRSVPVPYDGSLSVPMVIDQVWDFAPVSSGGSRNLTFSSVTTRSLTSSTPSRWQ